MPTSIVTNPTEVFTIEPDAYAKLDDSLKAEHARIRAACTYYKGLLIAFPQWFDTGFKATPRQREILYWVARRIRQDPDADLMEIPYGFVWWLSREWAGFSFWLNGEPVSYILT